MTQTLLAALPMAPRCKHYAFTGREHFCRAINAECKPIQDGPDCTACPVPFVPRQAKKPAPAKADALQCVHLGEPIGETVQCSDCPSATKYPIHQCEVRGTCLPTIGRHSHGLTSCAKCSDRKVSSEFAPERTIKLDLPDHFNAGLIDFRGQLLLATRYGWASSKIFLHELDDDLQPGRSRDLRITHPQALSGAEDPRLFVYRDNLHVAITGYERSRTPRTSQLVARLSDHLNVEEVWAPKYADRQPWEKNWQFFEHAGNLLSIYNILPQHTILEHNGADTAVVAKVKHNFRIDGCAMRGGAPPVRVADEYYHWFHTVKQVGTDYTYGLGLYTFGDDFAISRVVPNVIMTASERVSGWNKSVVFPCGAILRDGKWIISYGYHDRESRLVIYDAGQVEKQLRKAP